MTRFGLQSDACLSHMTIVCLHYFTLKWESSAGGRRTGESFKGDRVSVWGDESLLEMGSGNDCPAMWRKHALACRSPAGPGLDGGACPRSD